MSYMLKPEWQKSQFPPGGFPYTDKRTGFVFDATAGGLNDRVNDVRRHRMANTHVYKDASDFDRERIKQEIVDFMCIKNPSLCSDVDLAVTALKVDETPAPVPSHPCVKCGSLDATPNYCVSCGGQKVRSWTCSNCGNVFSP